MNQFEAYLRQRGRWKSEGSMERQKKSEREHSEQGKQTSFEHYKGKHPREIQGQFKVVHFWHM